MTRARDVASNGGLVLVSSTTIGSAVSSVVVNNAFSATYDNYKIIVSGGVASANSFMTLKLGATATGYYWAHVARGYNNVDQSASSNTALSWARISAGSTDLLQANCDVQNPFNAKFTTIVYTYNDPKTTGEAGAGGGLLANTTSYTDFTIAPTSGTYTGGTISVYGYKK